MILVQDQLKDQSEVRIDIEDRGYQFGDGVYEVVRIYNGQYFGMEEHLIRLERSAREIQMTLPYSIELLKERLEKLAKANDIRDGHVYLQITRGVAERTHQFPLQQAPFLVAYARKSPRPLSKMKDGITAITTEDIRWLRCDIKSLNLLGNVLGKQKAMDTKCDESIFIRNDIVTEGSSTNVYIVKNGEIWTHPANNFILNGITRQVVLDIAKETGITVHEETFTKNELMDADEVIISSTTMEVTPVISIDGTQVSNGEPGKVARTLQEKFNERIAQLQRVKN
ncbi:D-amino-acid transaminase [Pseudalkalibacillus sp. A8]|uniref:D-amino-acid transaminase n=1 Tax=Pseudalkalibacillus sp. A8 TaxID=3382641 RepID=UPI0038B603A3